MGNKLGQDILVNSVCDCTGHMVVGHAIGGIVRSGGSGAERGRSSAVIISASRSTSSSSSPHSVHLQMLSGRDMCNEKIAQAVHGDASRAGQDKVVTRHVTPSCRAMQVDRGTCTAAGHGWSDMKVALPRLCANGNA